MDSIIASREDIRYAYRLLLGREPDAVGMRTFQAMVATGRVTAGDMAALIMSSAEFRARQGIDADCIEVGFDGYSMFVRADDLDVGATVRNGTYEPQVVAAINEHLHVGATVLDVGANIGYYTALAAHKVGPTGRVFAVEPMDKNLQLIYRTIWHNRFRNVQVLPFAASDAAQLLPMATTARSSNGEVLPHDTQRAPSLFAQACVLDDLLPALDRLDLVKIDIEGHEPHAWRGLARTLARHRPVVLTEFHPQCLRDNAHVDPIAYLATLFAYASSVQVLVDQGTRVACDRPDQVMQQWHVADVRSGGRGDNHLDLLVHPASA
ncbi:MAG: FkbM family methyltransferase [Dokdonella sp.]|nr:MAG: FkbM family methyltransferase [Dokdonella sp.]MCZ2078169.1 FkbM family methyltransferase [Bryobacterales bacterium]